MAAACNIKTTRIYYNCPVNKLIKQPKRTNQNMLCAKIKKVINCCDGNTVCGVLIWIC